MATSDILALVQAAPDVKPRDADYVDTLIEQAKANLVSECSLSAFPLHTAGSSVSGAGATEDISGLASSTLYVSLHGEVFVLVDLTLSSCTSGAATAAHLQEAIRAARPSGGFEYVWETVSVVWDGAATTYAITSGTVGEGSDVKIDTTVNEYHVVQALKLGPKWGGSEAPGTDRDELLEALAADMVLETYRKVNPTAEVYDDATKRTVAIQETMRRFDKRVREWRLKHRELVV